MEILKKSDKNAVFLNHNEIISQTYQTHKFQPSIFNYIRKTSRKRKLPPDIEDLSKTTNAFLAILEPSNFKPSDELPKIWDEKIDFPNFEGGNNSETFTKFPFLNQTFLIPPNCRFINRSIFEIKEEDLGAFDFIVMDPPWKNKYIRRVKKADKSLGYKMIDNDSLAEMPIDRMVHSQSIVAIWCTNSPQHQKSLMEVFLEKWDLKLVVKWFWVKLSSHNEVVSDFNEENKKQPFETIFIACHKDFEEDLEELTKIQMVMSTPSIIHSHKPPLLKVFEKILPRNPRCCEVFARYLQPNFTSIGLEVLKLMDLRLYEENI